MDMDLTDISDLYSQLLGGSGSGGGGGGGGGDGSGDSSETKKKKGRSNSIFSFPPSPSSSSSGSASGEGAGGDESGEGEGEGEGHAHRVWDAFQRRLEANAEAIAAEADSLSDVSMSDVAEAAIDAGNAAGVDLSTIFTTFLRNAGGATKPSSPSSSSSSSSSSSFSASASETAEEAYARKKAAAHMNSIIKAQAPTPKVGRYPHSPPP